MVGGILTAPQVLLARTVCQRFHEHAWPTTSRAVLPVTTGDAGMLPRHGTVAPLLHECRHGWLCHPRPKEPPIGL